MKSGMSNALICMLLIALLAPFAAAQEIELRLADGSRWRGAVGNHVELRYMERNVEREITGKVVGHHELYLQVEGTVLGETRTRTIFKTDIVAIRTIDQPAPAREPDRRARRGADDRSPAKADDPASTDVPGVFLLPLKGGVGIEIRHQEIEAIAREADRYGPGQVIVFEIDTPGGLVIEMEQISRVMMEIKERHRLIAWVRQAISAGCATAIHCDEIYFTRDGTAGAMTAFAGETAWSGEQLRRWLETAGEWMEAGGRSRYIAHAMIHAPRSLSYDKDPETGEVTFYNNLSGKYILSRPGENLTFTADDAVHSGFANGIANTTDQLAKLLDMPKWREVNDAGRRIHERWMQDVTRARREVPRLIALYNMGTAGDAQENLGNRIQIVRQLISWWDRAPNILRFEFGVPPKEELERQLAELQKAMADLRRQQRR